MERCCEQGSATRKDADKIGAIQFFVSMYHYAGKFLPAGMEESVQDHFIPIKIPSSVICTGQHFI